MLASLVSGSSYHFRVPRNGSEPNMLAQQEKLTHELKATVLSVTRNCPSVTPLLQVRVVANGR